MGAECCDLGHNRDSHNICYNADWSTSMKSAGWSMCADGHYLSAIQRGGCDKLHCLTSGRCCADVADENPAWDHCYSTNTWATTEEGWARCADGYFVAGLKRGDSSDLLGIEMIKCCQPVPAVTPAATP